ncbi:MAG: PAS domain S-box protein [Ardenticatenaceae bacterium]|nr:PAS domain S-box protein [Ardenticatenaceae bacterium]
MPRPPLLRYGVAVLTTALALLLTLLLQSLIEPGPFLLFFAAVALTAWYGGLGPALLATLLGALASDYFLLPPLYAFALITPHTLARLTIFALVALLISWFSEARAQAEAAVGQQRELLRVTLTSIGDAVIATDTRGQITFMNPVAESLTRWSQADAVGQALGTVFKIVNEESRATVESPVARVIRDGAVVGLANHTLLLSRDGAEIPIDDSGAPIRDADGNIIGVVLVFRDITERKRAEEEQRKSREQLEIILQGVADGITAQDPTGRLIFANDAAARATGYPSAQALLEAPLSAVMQKFELLDESGERLPLEQLPGRLALQGRPSPETLLHFRVLATGEDRWSVVKATPVLDEQNRVQFAINIFHDITERKQAEETLATRARQQAAVAGFGQRAIVETDLSALLNDAVALVSQTLEVEYCKLLELLPDGETLLLRAGVGWKEGLVGSAVVQASGGSQGGYSLLSNEPVIVDDLRTDTRIGEPVLLHDHGVVSGLSVIVRGRDRPFGVLGAHTSRHRSFSVDDVHFLQAVANILAEAIERRRAEDEVQEQREWLRVTLASIGDAVIATDTRGRITFMNPAAESLTGWTQAQAAGQELRAVFTIFDEQTRQPAQSPLVRVIREGLVVGLANHTLLLSRDGAEIPIDDSGAPIRDADGDIIGVVLIFRDITGRRQAEAERERLLAEVQNQRQRLDNIVASVPGVVWEAWGRPDARGQRVDFVNDYVETMLGYSVHEWLSSPNFWLTIVHPEDRERAAQEAAAIFAGGKEGTNRFRWIAKDGRILWVEARSVVVCDETGTPIGMRGVTMDITERKRAEETQHFLVEASALLASSLDYETTLASVARLAVPHIADWCAVDIVADDGTIQRLAVEHVDPAKVALAHELQERYPPNPDAPYGVPQVLRTGEPEMYTEIADALLERGARKAESLEILRTLGLRSSLVVPMIARGRTLGAITFVTAESGRRYTSDDLLLGKDLARRAALAIDNARLYREAQEAIRTRDQFLSIASHELKTPLTALQGYAELLQRRAAREGLADQRDQRALRTIYEQSVRLHRLIELLLDLSRIRTGQLSLEQRPVDLGALTHRLVEEVRPTLEQHTLELICPAEPLTIMGDELRLEQVIQNLVQNAVKYSPSGGPVTVRLKRAGQQVQLAVSDRGIGIPAEALPQLFSRFYRARNVRAQQIEGMGLGLFVVKEIVTLHGGTVSVTSREGEGSTFTVWLPLHESGGSD